MTMTSAAYEFCTNAAHFIKSSTLVFKPAEHGPVNNDDSIMLLCILFIPYFSLFLFPFLFIVFFECMYFFF